MTGLRRSILVLPLLALALPGDSLAQCATGSGNVPPEGGITAIFFSPYDPNGPNPIAQGIGYWDNGCGSSVGTNFPALVEGAAPPGAPQVTVYVFQGASTNPTGSCGSSTVYVSNGRLIGGSIDLWTSDTGGHTCNLADTLAHEIGHIYGLGDNSCAGDIMGTTSPGIPRTVRPEDCSWIDENFRVPGELGGCISNRAALAERVRLTKCSCYQCPEDLCCGGSPILIDLDGHGFKLTGAEDPVPFDLNANGQADLIGWTERESETAFLVLDRNGNGVIDDGRELFGNYSPMPDGSKPPNGYVALAVFDQPAQGGNGDGVISSADAIYGSLAVWVDANHDGISEPGEIRSLASAGVLGIDLAFHEDHKVDRWGNAFAFRSEATVIGPHGRARSVRTYDVFFVRAGGL